MHEPKVWFDKFGVPTLHFARRLMQLAHGHELRAARAGSVVNRTKHLNHAAWYRGKAGEIVVAHYDAQKPTA